MPTLDQNKEKGLKQVVDEAADYLALPAQEARKKVKGAIYTEIPPHIDEFLSTVDDPDVLEEIIEMAKTRHSDLAKKSAVVDREAKKNNKLDLWNSDLSPLFNDNNSVTYPSLAEMRSPEIIKQEEKLVAIEMDENLYKKVQATNEILPEGAMVFVHFPHKSATLKAPDGKMISIVVNLDKDGNVKDYFLREISQN